MRPPPKHGPRGGSWRQTYPAEPATHSFHLGTLQVAPGRVFGTPPNQLAFSASGSPALIGQLSASMGHGLPGIRRHRRAAGRTGTEASWPSASSRLTSRGQRSISVSLPGVRVQFRDATDAASLTCQPEERLVQAIIKPGLNIELPQVPM
jgi:hypothetical protein